MDSWWNCVRELNNMEYIQKIGDYDVYVLNKEVATTYIDEIMNLVNLIPMVSYSKEDILADSKIERDFLGKWEHSLIVLHNNKPIAIIIGYERKKENNDQYPTNTLYISELAVDEMYQGKGLAKQLIQCFLDINQSFLYLTGDISISVQTNAADWNAKVISLYKSFGFQQISTKQYDNRLDVVLQLKPRYL